MDSDAPKLTISTLQTQKYSFAQGRRCLESQQRIDDLLLPFVRWTTLDQIDCTNRMNPLLLVEQINMLRCPTVPYFWRRFPMLTALNLRSMVHDDFIVVKLLPVLAAVHPTLKTLLLSRRYEVPQEVLDHFTQLEELDTSVNRLVKNVHFCSGTLRKLYADDTNLTDEGLSRAVHLEVLHVSNVEHVMTTVAPFAAPLRELKAVGWCCGITNEGLSMAHGIVKLYVSYNTKITTVAPFAESLRDLDASWNSVISDASLSLATGIVKLDIEWNREVTTVAPFAKSLRELIVKTGCVTDEGLSVKP